MKQNCFPEKYAGDCWEQNAKVWSMLVRKKQDKYRELLNNPAFIDLVGNVKGKKTLDLGCGEGYNTRIFAKLGAKITGIDISQEMISQALKKEKRTPMGIDYKVSSFSDLSMFTNNSFDIVLSTMALMDSPDYDKAIKEAHRVLKTHGKIFFSISHPCFQTKGFSWIKNENGKSKTLTVSNYFTDSSWDTTWIFSKGQIPEGAKPFNVPCFPRTLSEYLNVLIDSGFNILRVNEPRPSEMACKKHPWLRRWRDHAAIFLHISAEKRNGGARPKRPRKTRE